MKVMEQKKALTGNQAAAHAAKLARLQAGFFFPIGPADEVIETVVEMIQRGELVGCEVTQLQNERGCVGAQLAACVLGLRTMFATSHDGLIWATEQVMYAAADRIPLMIVVASRAMSAPGNAIGTDYFEMVMMREYGGLMFYCESSQDILDTILQAYKVAEDPRVRLPVVVGWDGWEVSHGSFVLSIPSQEAVDRFLPPYMPARHAPAGDLLTFDCWAAYQERTMRALGAPWVQENKFKAHLAREQVAKQLVETVGSEYRELFGRDHVGLLETYKVEDADVVLITMGAITATARFVCDALRKGGNKVGVVKLRCFRPFPQEALVQRLRNAKCLVVLERSPSDAVLREVQASFYGSEAQPLILGRAVGICGRDVPYHDMIGFVEEGFQAVRSGKVDNKFDFGQIRGRNSAK